MRATVGAVFVLLVVSGLTAAERSFQDSRTSSSPKPGIAGTSPLTGTWKLVSGRRAGSSNESPVGLMVYDPDGYVGLAAMDGGRQKYAGSEPTPAEAKAAFDSFQSLFGTYVVNRATSTVTLHLDGSLDPNLTGSDYAFSFARSGNQLTLKPTSPAAPRQETLVWERLPDRTDLSPTHRRLIGFWKLVPNEGEKTAPASGQGQRRGFIIYTAAGFMAVHIMPGGRAKHVGREATPEEAKAALRGYASYFGPYTVNEQDRYVVHQRIGHTIPASVGTNGQRFYEFVGKRLVLRFLSTTFTVPATLQEAKSEGREPGTITWERVSADFAPNKQ